MVVEEVRRVREVGAPPEQVERQRAAVDVVDERRRLLQVEVGGDADVGELGLDVRGDLRRLRQVRPGFLAVAEVDLDPVRVRLGDHLRGRLRVVLEVDEAVVVAGNARRQELRRRLRAGRIERVDDALAVDADRDGLAQHRIVERLHVDVEADVEDVQRVAGDQLQVRRSTRSPRCRWCRRCRCRRRARLQLHEPLGALRVPLEHGGRRGRRLAPVVGVGLEHDLAAALPGAEHVRPGADRLVDQPVGVLEVLARGDASEANGTLAGIAGSGLHSVSTNVSGVGRLQLGDVAGVRLGAARGALVVGEEHVAGGRAAGRSVPAGAALPGEGAAGSCPLVLCPRGPCRPVRCLPVPSLLVRCLPVRCSAAARRRGSGRGDRRDERGAGQCDRRLAPMASHVTPLDWWSDASPAGRRAGGVTPQSALA